MSVTIRSNFNDVQRFLDTVGEVAASMVRPVAQAGAQIFYEEARRLAGRSSRPHLFYGTSYRPTKGRRFGRNENVPGRYLFYPGTLQNAIYQVYSEDNSSDKRATYHVSWNLQKAPYGVMVEYGLSPFIKESRPFLRPAFVNKYAEAERAMVEKAAQLIGEI